MIRGAVLAGAMLLGAASARAQAAGAAALLEEARRLESSGDSDRAARRYTDALGLDPTCGGCYLGLGALRLARGDTREADRVYSVALEHVPQLNEALLARAHVRKKLGWLVEAEADLTTYAARESDPAAWRELADLYGSSGRAPAQLATWRRILVLATTRGDAALAGEARTTIRALQLLVGPADPVVTPAPPVNATRRSLAAIARRGGGT